VRAVQGETRLLSVLPPRVLSFISGELSSS
jgi:hypothetical protein